MPKEQQASSSSESSNSDRNVDRDNNILIQDQKVVPALDEMIEELNEILKQPEG